MTERYFTYLPAYLLPANLPTNLPDLTSPTNVSSRSLSRQSLELA